MGNDSIQQKFTAALATLIEQVKQDRSVLAAILCGSLAHDTVWAKSDIVMLKTIADQVAQAFLNARLRSLVKNLAVTDEKSGLLKRASYLDLLQAETRRGLQQGTAVTVLLMHFGKRGVLVKEFGEAAVEAVMEQVGQLFSANIRSNDLAFRYEATRRLLLT